MCLAFFSISKLLSLSLSLSLSLPPLLPCIILLHYQSMAFYHLISVLPKTSHLCLSVSLKTNCREIHICSHTLCRNVIWLWDNMHGWREEAMCLGGEWYNAISHYYNNNYSSHTVGSNIIMVILYNSRLWPCKLQGFPGSDNTGLQIIVEGSNTNNMLYNCLFLKVLTIITCCCCYC